MKGKMSITIEKELIQMFKRQRVQHGCVNDSQFMEWILRQLLYRPNDLLRLQKKELAKQMFIIDESIKNNEDLEINKPVLCKY